jgi:hypothetical protein
MANVVITIGENRPLPQKAYDIIVTAYQPAMEGIGEVIAKEYGLDPVKINLAMDELQDDFYKIVIDAPGVSITRYINVKDGIIEHSFFQLDEALQRFKISDLVLKSTVVMSDGFGLRVGQLDANLDVGGYTWFRKGAWPKDGANGLRKLVDRFGTQSRYPGRQRLAAEFVAATKSMTDLELRVFVLSPEFRKFSDLFLGTSWEGEFALTDPTTRIAMTQGADAAFESVVKSAPVTPAVALTVNQQILNDYVQQHIRVMSYSSEIARSSQLILNQTEEIINDLLLKYASKFEGLDKTSAAAKGLFRRLKLDLMEARQVGWERVNSTIIEELQKYAASQGKVAAKFIEGAVPVVLNLSVPSTSRMKALVDARPFEGRTLKEWLKRTENVDIDRLSKMAVSGIVDGLTPTQLARSVLGTQAMKGLDGYSRKAFKDLESVLLTVNSGIQNEARTMLYQENAEFFTYEYFVATLDINTTFECAGYDGQKFKIGTGPTPPLHFRCRSLRAPFITEEAFGNRPYKPTYERQLVEDFQKEKGLKGYKTRESLPKGLKSAYDTFARQRTRELVGQVPALTNFDTWLRGQGTGFQNEYLGAARAAAFRRGEFNLSGFTNSSGRVYTEAELGISA